MLIASPGAGKNIEQELKDFFRSANVRVAPISGLGTSAAAAFTSEGGDEALVALMATDGPFTLNMLAPAGGESSATFAKASDLMKTALGRAKAAK